MKVPRVVRYGLILLALAGGWVAAGYLGGREATRPTTVPASRPAAR